MPIYAPAFTGTHCTYPRRDGQAELTWQEDLNGPHKRLQNPVS